MPYMFGASVWPIGDWRLRKSNLAGRFIIGGGDCWARGADRGFVGGAYPAWSKTDRQDAKSAEYAKKVVYALNDVDWAIVLHLSGHIW